MTANGYSCPACGREATTKNARVGKGNLLRLVIFAAMMAECGGAFAMMGFRDSRTALDDDEFEAFVAAHSNEICLFWKS